MASIEGDGCRDMIAQKGPHEVVDLSSPEDVNLSTPEDDVVDLTRLEDEEVIDLTSPAHEVVDLSSPRDSFVSSSPPPDNSLDVAMLLGSSEGLSSPSADLQRGTLQSASTHNPHYCQDGSEHAQNPHYHEGSEHARSPHQYHDGNEDNLDVLLLLLESKGDSSSSPAVMQQGNSNPFPAAHCRDGGSRGVLGVVTPSGSETDHSDQPDSEDKLDMAEQLGGSKVNHSHQPSSEDESVCVVPDSGSPRDEGVGGSGMDGMELNSHRSNTSTSSRMELVCRRSSDAESHRNDTGMELTCHSHRNDVPVDSGGMESSSDSKTDSGFKIADLQGESSCSTDYDSDFASYRESRKRKRAGRERLSPSPSHPPEKRPKGSLPSAAAKENPSPWPRTRRQRQRWLKKLERERRVRRKRLWRRNRKMRRKERECGGTEDRREPAAELNQTAQQDVGISTTKKPTGSGSKRRFLMLPFGKCYGWPLFHTDT